MEKRRIAYRDYRRYGFEAVKGTYDKDTKTIVVWVSDKEAKVFQALSGKYVEITDDDRKALYDYLYNLRCWDAETVDKGIEWFA